MPDNSEVRTPLEQDIADMIFELVPATDYCPYCERKLSTVVVEVADDWMAWNEMVRMVIKIVRDEVDKEHQGENK